MNPGTDGFGGDPAESAPVADGLHAAARDALATIDGYLRGDVDGAHACRALVNDEPLREIVPIGLLLGFIGVEAQFGVDPDEEAARSRDPEELAELRAEREELLREVREELERECVTLAAHLRQWQLDHPQPPAAG